MDCNMVCKYKHDDGYCQHVAVVMGGLKNCKLRSTLFTNERGTPVLDCNTCTDLRRQLADRDAVIEKLLSWPKCKKCGDDAKGTTYTEIIEQLEDSRLTCATCGHVYIVRVLFVCDESNPLPPERKAEGDGK